VNICTLNISYAGAVAKYCDEHVFVSVCLYVLSVFCVCVCLSVCQDIAGTTRNPIFTNFSVHVAYGRGSVLLRQGD